jgi:cytochrome c oxidase subunit IV
MYWERCSVSQQRQQLLLSSRGLPSLFFLLDSHPYLNHQISLLLKVCQIAPYRLHPQVMLGGCVMSGAAYVIALVYVHLEWERLALMKAQVDPVPAMHASFCLQKWLGLSIWVLV